MFCGLILVVGNGAFRVLDIGGAMRICESCECCELFANDANSEKIKFMVEIIYKRESYFLNGLFFKVHNTLGRFCKEKQYCDELEQVLIENNVNYKREYVFSRNCENIQKGDRVDFMVDEKIILEIKAKPLITKADYYQTQRYLRATDCKLGLIVNFRNNYIKPKRALNKHCSIYL